MHEDTLIAFFEKGDIRGSSIQLRLLAGEPLPDDTWLVHFTDAPDRIAEEGFRYGTPNMHHLGCTLSAPQSSKAGGGFNFAFLPDSRDARQFGAMAAGAVMFRASAVLFEHMGDHETQAVFWGPAIPPDDMVVLRRDGKDWTSDGGRHGSFRAAARSVMAEPSAPRP